MQQHHPGRLAASDFTHMEELGVTIQGQSFAHLIYHFVLTYSNWETGTVCFSESFESLSEGLQTALWELGKVPSRHRTDRLSTAVNNSLRPAEFTDRYEGLMRYYGLAAEKIQAGHGNENGDVEQRIIASSVPRSRNCCFGAVVGELVCSLCARNSGLEQGGEVGPLETHGIFNSRLMASSSRRREISKLTRCQAESCAALLARSRGATFIASPGGRIPRPRTIQL